MSESLRLAILAHKQGMQAQMAAERFDVELVAMLRALEIEQDQDLTAWDRLGAKPRKPKPTDKEKTP